MSADPTSMAALAAKMNGTTPSRTRRPAHGAQSRPAPPSGPPTPSSVEDTVAEQPSETDEPATVPDAAESKPVAPEPVIEDAEIVDDEPQAQPSPPPPAKSSKKASKEVELVEKPPAKSSVATAQALATKAKAGDLVSVRVQPPELGMWCNALLEGAAFSLKAREGDVMAALLYTAQANMDAVFAVLEQWAGTPTDLVKRMVWEQLKAAEEERWAQAQAD